MPEQFRRVCQYCGEPLILDGLNECRYCGAPTPSSLRCEYCGGANSWMDTRCHKCGADISEQRMLEKFRERFSNKTFTGVLGIPINKEVEKDCIAIWKGTYWRATGEKDGDRATYYLYDPRIEHDVNPKVIFTGDFYGEQIGWEYDKDNGGVLSPPIEIAPNGDLFFRGTFQK